MSGESTPSFSPSDVPSSAPIFILDYFTQSPTPFYTQPPYPINNSTPQYPNEIPISRFVVYLFCTILILVFILYLNKCNPPPTPTAAPAPAPATNGSTDPASQNQVDLVKSMTPQERREYVTNFLKTQKYVDGQDHGNVAATAPSSFRVAKSSSLRWDTDNDVESNKPDNTDDSQNMDNVTSPRAYPSCAICIERFQNGEDICVAQNKECPHEFHLECLFPWLLKSQDCPCCRRDYLSIEPPPAVNDETTTTATPILQTTASC